ncbi:coiled-coil domain-containing protein 84 isoform X2 [Huso huso]|uniref:Coiled-coil domain-containing protein 84 isoform X2 n=1 Tax=Huso huso TaxID=61971 RepID=A0ABR0Y9D7_HUSHU
MGAFYCSVCKQTFFAGKSHIFGKKHQDKLKIVLTKFLDKVKEARRMLKAPAVEKYDVTEHELNLWCYCCGAEVQKHITNGNLTVLCGGLLEHMASPEHRKQTDRFWWENKADSKLKEKFLFSEEEMDRFKTEVAKALESYEEKEDEFIKQQASYIREVEQRRQEVMQSILEPESESESPQGPPQCGPPGHIESSGNRDNYRRGGAGKRAGPSGADEFEDSDSAGAGLDLTFIGYQDSSSGGNVHTGATPPWLKQDPEEGGSGTQEPQAGPSHEEFLKHKEQEKLRKLPASRVGANFDHASQTDAGWLPSFGRVWNSGRRWQSRHQFRAEEGQGTNHKRKKHEPWKGSKKHKPADS